MALVVVGGCFADIDKAELVHRAGMQVVADGSGARGGEVMASAGDMGFQFQLGIFGQRMYRTAEGDPNSHGAGGVEGGLRWSPLGGNRDDHRLERWIDFGLELRLGGGLIHAAHIEGFGSRSVGGWIELGTGRARSPVLVLGVRSEAYEGYQMTYDSATVVSLGLSFVSRRPSEGNDFLGGWL